MWDFVATNVALTKRVLKMIFNVGLPLAFRFAQASSRAIRQLAVRSAAAHPPFGRCLLSLSQKTVVFRLSDRLLRAQYVLDDDHNAKHKYRYFLLVKMIDYALGE